MKKTMKKIYVTPTIEIQQIQTLQLLNSASLPIGDDGSANNAEGRRHRFYIDDEEYDDED